MSAYYIGCDLTPNENNAGTRLQCNYSNGAVAYTEQQIIDQYSGALTQEEAWYFSSYLYAGALLAYGFKVISHKIRFGR